MTRTQSTISWAASKWRRAVSRSYIRAGTPPAASTTRVVRKSAFSSVGSSVHNLQRPVEKIGRVHQIVPLEILRKADDAACPQSLFRGLLTEENGGIMDTGIVQRDSGRQIGFRLRPVVLRGKSVCVRLFSLGVREMRVGGHAWLFGGCGQFSCMERTLLGYNISVTALSHSFPLTLGASAPDGILADVNGNAVSLSHVWKQGTTAFVFLRHLGCVFCREQVAVLRRDYAKLQEANIDVACIAQGDAQTGKAFSLFFDLPFPLLLCGDDISVYEAYGLARGTMGQLFGLRSWTRGIAAVLQGRPQGRLVGNGFQLGGVFVVDAKRHRTLDPSMHRRSRYCLGRKYSRRKPFLYAAKGKHMNSQKRGAVLGSFLLAGSIVVSALSGQAAPPKLVPAPSAAMLSHGKSVAARYGCANCHGAGLAGKKGFAPSLHASGVLREYNPVTFVRVMDTGQTNDGGYVRKPMPVYHLKAADSRPLYAYLKSLK